MKDKSTIVSYTLEEIENLPDDTDWDRVDAMTDEEIYQNALNDPDAQPTDDSFWDGAEIINGSSGELIVIGKLMKIKINGEGREIPKNTTLFQLLIELELDAKKSGIAIALNYEVVPRNDWKNREISDGDEIELIRAVQGG